MDTLRNALRQESGALAIDLKNVSLVDRDAVQLLALAEYNGTELRNCPAYVREWVTRERAECARRSRTCHRRKGVSTMFQTNHDGSISSGIKPWEDEKRFMSSSDQLELHGRSQCFADGSAVLRVVGAEQAEILESLNAEHL